MSTKDDFTNMIQPSRVYGYCFYYLHGFCLLYIVYKVVKWGLHKLIPILNIVLKSYWTFWSLVQLMSKQFLIYYLVNIHFRPISFWHVSFIMFFFSAANMVIAANFSMLLSNSRSPILLDLALVPYIFRMQLSNKSLILLDLGYKTIHNHKTIHIWKLHQILVLNTRIQPRLVILYMDYVFFHPACIRPNFSSMVLNCVPPYSACTIFSITYWDVFSWVIFILSLPTMLHFQSVSSHLKTSGQDHLLWHQQIQIPCNILRLNPKHLLTSEFPLQLMRINRVLPLWLLH